MIASIEKRGVLSVNTDTTNKWWVRYVLTGKQPDRPAFCDHKLCGCVWGHTYYYLH